MLGVEIPNPVVMVTFTAANPPVVKSRTANVVSVTRANAGQYLINLSEQLPGDGVDAPVNLQSSSLGAAATFVGALEDTSGNIAIEARNLAGALNDTGALISVVAYAYPTTA